MIILLVGLTGCVPAALSRGPFAELSIAQVQSESQPGARVRWGGRIVETVPEPGQTCIEIVGYRLDRSARPRAGDETIGRFLACANGFYDPAVYSEDREVTVIGIVEGETTGLIGDFEYRYPRLQAEAIYLWPKPEPLAPAYYSPWVSPLWYPMWGPPPRYYYPSPAPPSRPRPRPVPRPVSPRR